MGNELDQYRQGLIDTQRKLNENYDNLLVTLSGGALALSITFLKDIIGSNEMVYPYFLLIAWSLFVLSLASILGEILFGILAHKKAITQVDDNTIYEKKVGGISSNISTILHWSSAVSLVLGLIFISIFSFYNIGGIHGRAKTNSKATTHTSTEAKASSKPSAKTTG
jgi:hypothetical protein